MSGDTCCRAASCFGKRCKSGLVFNARRVICVGVCECQLYRGGREGRIGGLHALDIGLANEPLDVGFANEPCLQQAQCKHVTGSASGEYVAQLGVEFL